MEKLLKPLSSLWSQPLSWLCPKSSLSVLASLRQALMVVSRILTAKGTAEVTLSPWALGDLGSAPASRTDALTQQDLYPETQRWRTRCL